MIDIVTAELKAVKKSFDNSSDNSFEKMKALPVFMVDTSPQWTEIFTSSEGFSGTKETSEFGVPDVNRLQDGYSITLTDKRYTNSINVSSTDQRKMKDGTIKIDTYLTRQRNEILKDINYLAAKHLTEFFDDAFAGAIHLSPDGVALAGTHSWNTPGSATWTNTTTSKLTETAVDTAVEFGADFKSADGKELVQSYDTIIVKKGSENHRNAKRLFAEGITPTQINDINIYEGGEYRIIALPMIATANKNFWFMMDTQHESPLYMGVGTAPHMLAPRMESNASMTSIVEGFWKRGINNMPYNIYCGQGTV